MGWRPNGDWLNGKAVLFSVAVGLPCIFKLYAAIFRRSLLGARPAPSGLMTHTGQVITHVNRRFHSEPGQ
jgi:hypothetical protein